MTTAFDIAVGPGLRAARSLGTWVLVWALQAREIQHFAGYLLYSAEDLERIARAGTEDRRGMAAQILHWRRAARWIASLPPGDWRQLVEATRREAVASGVPYKVSGTWHPSLPDGATLPPRPGPPIKLDKPIPMAPCALCGTPIGRPPP